MKNVDSKPDGHCANLNDCRARPACASLPVMNTPKRPMQPPMEEPLDHRQFVAALSPEQRRAARTAKISPVPSRWAEGKDAKVFDTKGERRRSRPTAQRASCATLGPAARSAVGDKSAQRLSIDTQHAAL